MRFRGERGDLPARIERRRFGKLLRSCGDVLLQVLGAPFGIVRESGEWHVFCGRERFRNTDRLLGAGSFAAEVGKGRRKSGHLFRLIRGGTGELF